jgi:seryl-tRNA synthetase
MEIEMHDPRHLLDPATDAVRRLSRRGYSLDIDRLGSLVSSRSQAIQATDSARTEAKRLASAVQAAGRAGEPTAELTEQARAIKTHIQKLEVELDQHEAALQELMLEIPNVPEDRCPDGDSDEFATEIRREGNPPVFDFDPLDHADLGERLGILDFAGATRLSGPRFAVLKGAGAAMSRALGSLFLSLHTGRHGYVEYSVPSLVSRKTMTGTGQLPKFEQDLFKTSVGDRELFLIPTAEVPLTNLYAGEALRENDLPIAMTAHTPCFRSEAGSYGRDTRGLIRMHEFAKVELVRICRPEESSKELEIMVGHAEACLRELGLAYRVVALAAGDIGFAAQFTYDLEVWVPSQNRYREISSVSDCSTFQARRAGIRYTDNAGKRGFAATLNGSGLPVGRTLVAILEQYQQHDGSIRVPEALVPFTGFQKILADGTTA